eukprot:TRINITY_DN44725_c0_g1_i1.p1 TRINITY_DN44725_c0_g1~~TRINITY_DN44725_c0_g1_i1.p1  ORF type:complete len:382 (+),score=80.41 TRINITY_DN44725_c0_g1_i1:143-1288(+)
MKVLGGLLVFFLRKPADATVISSSDEVLYKAFRTRHGRAEAEGSDEYKHRLQLFALRRQQVEEHNSQPDKTWWATLNKFADITQQEYEAMLGYRRVEQQQQRGGQIMRRSVDASASLLQADDNVQEYTHSESRDWRSLTSSMFFRQQGSCGSCWAVAATGALEMHAELKHAMTTPGKLSFQQVVDCTPNPRNCGGQGGCSGATAELALQYVKEHGITLAESYADGDADGHCQTDHKPALHTKGFVRLPVNKLAPLLSAVSNEGPVVVSADAGPWSLYSKGVFNGCSRDAEVNHAVLMVGYGHDPKAGNDGRDYWLVRNSWGQSWGEDGFIRIERHSSDSGEDGHCGIDHNPKEGVACDGDPPTLPVCGMCGILSDSTYPKL